MGYVMLCEGIFMSRGDTLTPMKGVFLGVLTNLVLDPLLIFSLGLGISGAAQATLIGYLVSAVYLWRKLRLHKLVTPGLRITSGYKYYWKRIMSLGAVISVTQLFIPVNITLMNGVLAGFGPAAIGALNIMVRLETMGILPLYGMALALVPFIGYNLGAGNIQRIHSGIRFFLRSSLVIIVPVAIFFIFLPGLAVAPFRSTGEVMVLTEYAIRLSAFGQILLPLELALMALSQGIKRPWPSMTVIFFRLFLVRYPLALFLSRLGIREIFWSQPVSMVAGALFSGTLLWWLLKTIHLEKKEHQGVINSA